MSQQYRKQVILCFTSCIQKQSEKDTGFMTKYSGYLMTTLLNHIETLMLHVPGTTKQSFER